MDAPGQRVACFRSLRMTARGVKGRASGCWSHTSSAAWVPTLLPPQALAPLAMKQEVRPDAHVWPRAVRALNSEPGTAMAAALGGEPLGGPALSLIP